MARRPSHTNVDPVPESRLDAILPPERCLGVTEALERARRAGHEVDIAPAPGLRWSIEGLDWRAGLAPLPREALDVFVAAGRLARELADRGAMALSVFTHLPPRCQQAYQDQVAVLHQIAPEALAVYDANAHTVLSPAIVRDLASVPVPPPPSRLYSIHQVTRRGLTWMHTHGLSRCGTVEIELMDVPSDRVSDMKSLLDAAAARLIEEAAPPSQCAAFEVSRETKVSWVPWSKAMAKLGIQGPGADRDASHSSATGVLVARPRRWRTCLPHEVIEGRPRVLISRAETQRMAAGSRARWPRLVRLFQERSGSRGWRFLVKASFAASGPCGPEHLWVELASAGAEGWAGRVLSEACRASVQRGSLLSGELDAVSGFQVRTPEGSYGPDELAELEEAEVEPLAPAADRA